MWSFLVAGDRKGASKSLIILNENELIEDTGCCGNMARYEVLSGTLIIETRAGERHICENRTKCVLPNSDIKQFLATGGRCIFFKERL
jgi:hypothetical protein